MVLTLLSSVSKHYKNIKGGPSILCQGHAIMGDAVFTHDHHVPAFLHRDTDPAPGALQRTYEVHSVFKAHTCFFRMRDFYRPGPYPLMSNFLERVFAHVPSGAGDFFLDEIHKLDIS